MKCPAKYLGRWALFLCLYLIVFPCFVLCVSVFESVKRAAALGKELWGELRDDFYPGIKSDFMSCLRGEPFI